MKNIELFISLLLLLFALSILIFLVYSLLRPLLSLFKVFKETSKIKFATQKLQSVEKLLEQDKTAKALEELKKTFILDRFQTEQSIQALSSHHQEVLSKCISAAEQLGGRLENLAKVESMLSERTEMLTLYNKASFSFQNLKNKRLKEGKKIPNWSKDEYKTRVEQIKQELGRNEKSLEEEINKLFMFLNNRSQENIVYH